MSKTAFIRKGLPNSAQDIMTKIGKNCAIARKKQHLSMEDVASRVFVTRQTISKMEKGDPAVTIGTYLTYAFVLGLESSFKQLFMPISDLNPTNKPSKNTKIDPDLNF